jgi:hypothetical protein
MNILKNIYLDEIFASVFAEMAMCTLLACQKLDHASFKASVLASILAAPSYMLALLPEKGSMFAQPLLPTPVLKVIEECTQKALRCYKVKAFLSTDGLKNMTKGQLIYLEEKSPNNPGQRDMQQSSVKKGVAGLVADTKLWHIEVCITIR